MKETLRHTEIFEYYYAQGSGRSLQKVADKFAISRQSLSKWLKNFNWRERIRMRDIENAKEIAKRADITIVATKADYRKDIKNSLLIVKKIILTAVDSKTKQLKIEAKTPADIKALISAQETLYKLDLLLVGEATDRTEVSNPDVLSDKTLEKIIND